MDYVLGAVVMLLWIGILFGSLILLINIQFDGSRFGNVLIDIGLGITGLILCIASLLWLVNQDEAKPCAQYDTKMQYNPATKTTMPMKYCAVQGEWVK